MAWNMVATYCNNASLVRRTFSSSAITITLSKN